MIYLNPYVIKKYLNKTIKKLITNVIITGGKMILIDYDLIDKTIRNLNNNLGIEIIVNLSKLSSIIKSEYNTKKESIAALEELEKLNKDIIKLYSLTVTILNTKKIAYSNHDMEQARRIEKGEEYMNQYGGGK